MLPIREKGSAEALGPAIFHLIDRAGLSVPRLEEGFSLDHTILEVGYTSEGVGTCSMVQVVVGHITQPIGYLVFI